MNMVIGIGSDLIETTRVQDACKKEAFFTRCFTIHEQQLINQDIEKASGNFAVKEAVSKALGTGFRSFSLKDIEVLRDELGKPYVNLYGNAATLQEQLSISHIHVTISNTKEYTMAFAVAEVLQEK